MNIRDNLLVTIGSRAAYMDVQGYIQLPIGSEGEDLFSTLIRCEECGRAFSRRCIHYTHSDYIYWRCPTNNEYTAKRCPNNTILREDDLIDALSSYLKKILDDKESFAKMLAEKYMSQRRENPQQVNIKELESKKTKLQKSREKYMDMYANELIPMEMLKKKMSEINESIESIDDKLLMAQSETCATIKIEDAIDAAMKEIEDFLELKNATNVDIRRILDCITVDHEKHVKIHLKIQNLQQN